jgi:hypothetical protein
MTRRYTRTAGAPVQGAVRTTRLAPINVEDPIAHITAKLRGRGFTVLDEDQGIPQPTASGEYLIVRLWAIPPRAVVA